MDDKKQHNPQGENLENDQDMTGGDFKQTGSDQSVDQSKRGEKGGIAQEQYPEGAAEEWDSGEDFKQGQGDLGGSQT